MLKFIDFQEKTVKIKLSGHSVMANMLALGASDSGFESQCPDQNSG